MAIITKIEEQKNKKRVNIFVDDAFFCGLGKETAVVFKLKTGNVIDEKTLKEAVFDSEVKSAIEKSSSYIATRMHSKKELYDKLIKKGYEKQVALKALEKLEEYHYVDDDLFAKQFVEQNKKYSRKMVENKLKQKGVSSDIILENIGSDEENSDYELCELYAKKYAKGKDLSKEGAVQKMYASLARKGFNFEIIKRACKCVIDEDYDDNNFLD